MPRNSQNLIASYQDVSAATIAALSTQSTGIRLRNIPAGTFPTPIGTQVFLPGAGPVVGTPPELPSDGDTYEVIDADGTSNVLAPIIVTPPAGTTIDGFSGSFVFFGSHVEFMFTFDAEESNWILDIGGAGFPVVPATTSGTIGEQAAVGNLTPGAGGAAILWAETLFPQVAGRFRVNMTYQGTSSVSDTISMLLAVGGPGAISGGAQDTEDTNFFFNGGTPVVVAAGLTNQTTNTDVAGTKHLINVTAIVTVPLVVGVSGTLDAATIACRIATGAGGTALTLQLLEVSIEEIV